MLFTFCFHWGAYFPPSCRCHSAHCHFDLHFLMATDTDYLFLCLLAIYICFLRNIYFGPLPIVFIIVFMFLLLSCTDSWCVLAVSPWCDVWLAHVSFRPTGCLSVLLVAPRAVHVLVSLLASRVLVYASVAHAFGVIFMKSLPKPVSRIFSPMFSSRNFMTSWLRFMSLIHFQLISVSGVS